MRRLLLMRLTLCYLALVLLPSVVQAVNNEQQALIDEILDESLRANRVQACDGEKITLHCPRNTHIFVGTGFYGRVVPESQLCPSRQPTTSAHLTSYDASCDVLQAKTRLSELCDKKRKCNVVVEADTFEGDPCPITSKYLQMTYKCRPVSFESETFCSGGDMSLKCRDGRRLAIYSASFGRSPRHPAPSCTSPVATTRDCHLDVLPQVLSACHAKTECTLPVTIAELGRPPCTEGVAPVLNILFMCVNEEIFSEEAVNGDLPALEKYKKEMKSHQETTWERLSERPDAVEKSSQPVVPAILSPQVEEQKPSNDAGYISEEEWSMRSDEESTGAETVTANAENKQKLLICVSLSVLFAFILLTAACILRHCTKKAEEKKPQYSIERSRLLAASNSPYSVLGGPCSSTDLGDLDDRLFRYSLASPPRSSHYDF